ncbi:hypothetical protein EJC51_47120 [Streptomyces aquilus]|uniref:Uncharacterized protein n=1 Tax=Streptomyces aquilus TaxID=2548456 RepID=A0A3Q9C6K0_9ACTN|nr:hypothetical protein [Streptomyces aquilus]AZP14765.1 hypothetical protein EJC51_00425 [Streptomyces aquilus]AZP22939.1 hypothetical protein EJC51_47120 [Streptomyces aquilus]
MRGQDADAIFHSLPRIGVQAPYAAGYGFTVPMRAPINGTDRVRLTLASALKLTEVWMTAGQSFVKVLRHMIDLYTSRPMHFEVVPTVRLRSDALATALPELTPWFIKVLPEILFVETPDPPDGARRVRPFDHASSTPGRGTFAWVVSTARTSTAKLLGLGSFISNAPRRADVQAPPLQPRKDAPTEDVADCWHRGGQHRSRVTASPPVQRCTVGRSSCVTKAASSTGRRSDLHVSCLPDHV